MDQVSTLILEKVEKNNNFVEKWYSKLVYEVIDRFYKTQKLPPATFESVFTTEAPKEYNLFTLEGLQYDDYCYGVLIEQNFLYGSPIFACSFRGIVALNECTNALGELVTEDVLFITLETPLKRERQIYKIVIDNDGKKQFELDIKRSMYLNLPREVNRLNHIIQPDNTNMN